MSAPRPVGRPVRRTGPSVRRSVISLALLACLVCGWLVWDNQRIVTTTYAGVSVRLPAAFDGLRIVQVSDLHSRSFGKDNERLLEAIADARPDLIVLTGDLIDRTTADPATALDFSQRAAEIAPVFSVTGNHEGASPLRRELLEGLQARGVRTLAGTSADLERDGEVLRIAGVDDPLVAGTAADGDAGGSGFAQQLAAVATGPEDPCTVLLAHRPELVEEYAATGADLVLSGHAHGGQVRIPFIGGLVAPGQGLLPELTSGIVERGETHMVISRGLGNSLVPLRVNNKPELVVLVLRTR